MRCSRKRDLYLYRSFVWALAILMLVMGYFQLGDDNCISSGSTAGTGLFNIICQNFGWQGYVLFSFLSAVFLFFHGFNKKICDDSFGKKLN